MGITLYNAFSAFKSCAPIPSRTVDGDFVRARSLDRYVETEQNAEVAAKFGYGCEIMKHSSYSLSEESAITLHSSVTLHTYRGHFDWQNLVFMNMHETGETNLFPMKSHATIKYSSITLSSYWDFLT